MPLRILARLLPVLALACQWPGSGGGPETTEVPAFEIGPATTLDTALRALMVQLDTVVAGQDEAGARSLARVGAISDRLLETQLPFAWLSAESYSLEARLRQIQSRVDRIEALRTGGARREDVAEVVLELRADVVRLETELAAGGSPAPTPVGALLDSLDRSG
jgi:hypothetical protein